jgi:hypothetical protein
MYYEARLQCHINYEGDVLGRVIRKRDARAMTLTKEQYL